MYGHLEFIGLIFFFFSCCLCFLCVLSSDKISVFLNLQCFLCCNVTFSVVLLHFYIFGMMSTLYFHLFSMFLTLFFFFLCAAQAFGYYGKLLIPSISSISLNSKCCTFVFYNYLVFIILVIVLFQLFTAYCISILWQCMCIYFIKNNELLF